MSKGSTDEMSGKTGVTRIIHGVWREIRNRIRSYSNVEDLRNEKDIPGLIKSLGHSDLDVLYLAVEALGDLKDPAAIPPLVTMLSEDQYSAVRWKSAEALAKIGKIPLNR